MTCEHKFEVKYEPGYRMGVLMEISMVSRCKLCGAANPAVIEAMRDNVRKHGIELNKIADELENKTRLI